MTRTNDLEKFWAAIHDLWEARGDKPMTEIDGAWCVEIDGGWYIAANGTNKTVMVAPPSDVMPIEVRQFEAVVWFNGWLAMLVTPAGGSVCNGSAANLDTFCEAVRKAIATMATAGGDS